MHGVKHAYMHAVDSWRTTRLMHDGFDSRPGIVQPAGQPVAIWMALRRHTATRRRLEESPKSPDSGDEAARTNAGTRKPVVCVQCVGGDSIRLLEALASGERALAGRCSSLSAGRISATPHSVTTGTSHGIKNETQCKRFPTSLTQNVMPTARPHPVVEAGEAGSSWRLASPTPYVAHPDSHHVEVAGQRMGDEGVAQLQTGRLVNHANVWTLQLLPSPKCMHCAGVAVIDDREIRARLPRLSARLSSALCSR
jgi:hypothetical protein